MFAKNKYSSLVKESKGITIVALVIVFLSSILFTNPVFATTIPVGLGPFDIALDPGTNMLYVANSGSSTVSVINGSTNAVVATIPVGNGAGNINVNPNTHKVYLVDSGVSNQIQVIDGLPGSPTINTVIASITVGTNPVGLDVDPTTNMIYVGNFFSGTVSVINGSTNTVVTTIIVGSGASRIGIDSILHKVYVTNFFSNNLAVINSSTNTVIANIAVGASAVSARVDPNTHLVYVSNFGSGTVSVVNGSTNAVITSIPVGNNPSGISLDLIHGKIYNAIRGTNSVAVIDRTTNTVVASIPVGNLPQGVVFDPNNDMVYAANFGDGTVSVINALTINPPMANAGPDKVVLAGTHVTLNGTGLGGGGSLSFSWTQTAGPNVVLSGANTANPTFTAPTVNKTKVLTFDLVVNDGTFNSIPDSVNIIVKPLTTFIVPLVPTNGVLTGIVNVGNVKAGNTLDFEFVTPPNTLPSAKLQQSSVSSGVNGSNVAFSFTVAPTIPTNLPTPPINTALFFDVETNGIDFSNPTNFPNNQTPKTEFLVNNAFSSDSSFADGCPVIPFFLFKESANRWEQVGDPLKPNTNKIYATNSILNTINVIDGSTNAVTDSITVGNNPFYVRLNQNTHMLYVANSGSNTVTVINSTGNTVVATVPVSVRPVAVEPNLNTNMVYVANLGFNNVSVINGTTNTVVATIPVGSNPSGIAVNPVTNKIYVANFFSDTVSVINGSTNTVTAVIPVGVFPGGIFVDPNTNRVFVNNFGGNTVSVIDGFTNTVIDTISVGTSPTGLKVDSNTNKLYVANSGSDTISVIDLSINLVTNTIPVGVSPFSVDVNLNTNRVYVANSISSNVMVIDGSPGSSTENTVIATFPVGPGPDSIVLNSDVPNPVRDPSKDVIDISTGQKLQCAYIANHPHLSKFAIGGLVTVLALLGHGGGGVASPPAFTGDAFAADEYPLSINGKGFKLDNHTNTIPTTTLETGQLVHLKLLMYESAGSFDIQHVALYTNLQGVAPAISDLDTSITYEKGEPLQITDPNKIFSTANVTTSETNGKFELDYDITFAKPMQKSDIVVRTWDTYKYSSDAIILNAIQVDKNNSTNDQATDKTGNSAVSIQNTTPDLKENSTDIIPAIKEWAGYSPNPISDSQLLAKMGVKGQHIPSWVMKTTKWIVDGEISEQEFVNAIKYLSENGIIKQ